MSNPWFRLYSEFSHDPKVQTMTEQMQRRYIMVMCLRCSNSLVTLQETEIAFYLRISDAELAETKSLFISKGFVDSGWNLLNWEKRQMPSDSSNARVAKHRALQKEKQEDPSNGDVTLQKRKSNGLDKRRVDKKKEVDKSTSIRPLNKCPADFEISQELFNEIKTECDLVDIEQQTKIFRDHTFGVAKTDWAATWRNWMRTKQERLVEGSAKVKTIESFKQQDARIGRERWEQMTGEHHPDNTPMPPSNILNVIDATPVKRIGAAA